MKHGTRVIAFCEDPDGYKVELNEPIKNIKSERTYNVKKTSIL